MFKSFFNLTKRERKASVYFLGFLMVLVGVRYWVSSDKSTSVHPIVVQKSFYEAKDKEGGIKNSRKTSYVKNIPKRTQIERTSTKRNFSSDIKLTSYYDPNKMKEEDWVAFGMSKKQAATVNKFISSKGGITDAQELMDIYVLSDKSKAELAHWSRIEKGRVNEWNQNDFQKISGIGEVLSERIVKFRDKLGGFYSLNQIKEVYGLDSLVIEKVKKRAKVTGVHRLEINKLSYRELSDHPYIGKKEAKQIVKERTIRPFSEESHLFEVFSEEHEINRLKPYISYE